MLYFHFRIHDYDNCKHECVIEMKILYSHSLLEITDIKFRVWLYVQLSSMFNVSVLSAL